MFHSGKLAFGANRIGAAKIISDYQSQNRIHQKLQRLVVKLASLLLGTRRNLFVGPGTVSEGAFEQRAIIEVVSQNGFQEVKVSNRVFGILQNSPIITNAGSLLKNDNELPTRKRRSKQGLAVPAT